MKMLKDNKTSFILIKNFSKPKLYKTYEYNVLLYLKTNK